MHVSFENVMRSELTHSAAAHTNPKRQRGNQLRSSLTLRVSVHSDRVQYVFTSIYATSQPLRYSLWMILSASGTPFAFSFAASHSMTLPVR